MYYLVFVKGHLLARKWGLMNSKQNIQKPQELASQVERFVSCGEMVRIYLEQNGYDGLCEKDGVCGCVLEDLMPCDGDYAMACEAGYEVKYKNNDCPCGEGCDFHVVAGRKNINT